MRNVVLVSGLIYTGISLALSAVFLVLTILGGYTWVARIGGAAWVFMLSMIILMPVVTPMVKKRAGG
ncbi:MAG: hypothetical protein HYX91_02980 [Chloroflexi bacterium]|nr:hypothetical protein [Chloroflexota bacterium]